MTSLYFASPETTRTGGYTCQFCRTELPVGAHIRTLCDVGPRRGQWEKWIICESCAVPYERALQEYGAES